jgi:hypothetical protein
MRKLQFLLSMSLLACAPAPQGPHPVNVAAIRHDIQLAMPADRVVTSMGHTTADSAVVFTADRSGAARHEEHWAREAGRWKVGPTESTVAN